MGTEGEVTDDAHREAIKRDSYMEAYRKRVVKVSVWVVLTVLATGCHNYKPSGEIMGDLADDPLQALALVEGVFEGREARVAPCATWGHFTKPISSLSASSTRLHITCSNGAQLSFRYRDTPEINVNQTFLQPIVTFLRDQDGKRQEVLLGADAERAKSFGRGWFVLAQPRKLQNPAVDSVFSDAVMRYQTNPQTHAETLRRAQVQVESALKEHHVREAATIYRNTLKSATGWSEGHFNLALLFGDLEFYADAINEMRRYLFLVPTAPDARAAQDKIYEWERKTQ